jgi:hypothetical protein
MNYEQVSKLLERYWEGATSLAEEQQLKAYFQGTEIDERLVVYQPLFQAIAASKTIEAPKHLETPRMLPRREGSNGLFRKLLAAATLTGLVAGTWWFNQPVVPAVPEAIETVAQEQVQVLSSPQEVPIIVEAALPTKKRVQVRRRPSQVELPPEEAAAIIKSALALVSSKIKRGQVDAEKKLDKIKVLDQFIKYPAGG